MPSTTYQTLAVSDAELFQRFERLWRSLGAAIDTTVSIYMVESSGQPLAMTPDRLKTNTALSLLGGVPTAMMKQTHMSLGGPQGDTVRVTRPDAGSRYEVYQYCPTISLEMTTG
jgi:hypothetical protein